jgi:hypothetical protein
MPQDIYTQQQVWIGPASEVERCLNEVHAETNGEGHFRLDVPSGSLSFLTSGSELMVTSDMVYYDAGRRMSLHSLMVGRGKASEPAIIFGEE